MVWFFEREGARLEYEIRQERRGEPFEVAIRNAQRKRLERVENPSELLRRSAALWAALLATGWRPTAPPPPWTIPDDPDDPADRG